MKSGAVSSTFNISCSNVSGKTFSDAENIKIAYIIDVQIIVRDMKCVGDILGTEFCWPKEKKIKYKIAFYPISEVMFPKDMKDKCNPRKRSIIGV